MNSIMIFESDDQPLEVRLQVGTSTDNLSLHLKSIFTGKDLDDRPTTGDFSVVRQNARVTMQRVIA